MVKRLKTVPLQVRISSGLSDALESRVKATKEAKELEKSYGLKSLAVEDALRLYLEGAPALRALFEEVLEKYEEDAAQLTAEYAIDSASDLQRLYDQVREYRTRLEAILGGMPPLKKEGE
jgi:hypothetical protein